VSSETKNNGRFFTPRNRIIAGLASGTLVVESPYGGGSLQTVDYALDYGRIAMALPGRADDKSSYGSNLYIKQLKAAMVCSGSDIVHELGWDVVATPEATFAPETSAVETLNLAPDERSLYEAIGEGEAVDYEVLVERCGLPAQTVTSLLMSLELGGVVRTLPGRKIERA
jgi:DNA processing protein